MRLAFNLLITTGLLLAFNAMGWLTLNNDGSQVTFDNMTWPTFGSVLLIAVVMWLVGIVVGWLFIISIPFTLGLSLLAVPFIGWAVLTATEYFMPGTLSLHGFWVTTLCGFLLLVVKIVTGVKLTRS